VFRLLAENGDATAFPFERDLRAGPVPSDPGGRHLGQRIDAVSQNELVRQAVLDRIAARKADPAFQAAVRRAVKANQRVFERLAQT
jgi:hypothetical protein